MWDKQKAITCLILSAVGWLIFIGGILFDTFYPHTDEFSSMVRYGVMDMCAIAAAVIHVANCILGIVFLYQGTEYKAACITGLSVSAVFVICCIILCIFLFYIEYSYQSPPAQTTFYPPPL